MKLKRTMVYGIFIGAFLLLALSNGNAQSIFPGVPDRIDAEARYMFYFHGRIVEIKGIRPISEKYGAYEYEKILGALKDRGFIVISEARRRNTVTTRYAQKVVSQIGELLQAGVPPAHITVVGASKGSLIAMQVSTMLCNKEVNFVFMAACNDEVFHRYDINFCGNILSIYDEKDVLAGTCEKFVKNSSGIGKYKEIKLTVGTGHGILYKPLKEWIDPVVQWAKGQK